jgi:hypothetical protein
MMMITIPNVTINLQYPCGELQTFEWNTKFWITINK